MQYSDVAPFVSAEDREAYDRLWNEGMIQYHLNRAVVMEKRLLVRFRHKDALYEYVLQAIHKRGMVQLRHSSNETDDTIVKWLDHLTAARRLVDELGPNGV